MPLLDIPVTPDFDAFRRCVRREGTPRRVHVSELYQDGEIKDAVAARYDLDRGLDPADPFHALRREIAIQRFLGYDMIRHHAPGFDFVIPTLAASDTTAVGGQQRAQRNWINEHTGPIQTWDDFEQYAWPDTDRIDTRGLEWLEKNLPDDMAVYDLTAHILEQVSNLLGYETLFVKLLEEPELVDAVFQRVGEIYVEHCRFLAQFSCVGVLWGSDDLGFRTQTFLSPVDLREKVIPWHRRCADVAHEHGKLYFLHSCGNLEGILDDFIDDVNIDAKHSFEDAIQPVTEVVRRYGDRIAILGGIDMDFMIRSDESAIRRRVRETLEQCHEGGGYALGTGNSVANYMPLDNYLALLDEGRRFGC